MRAKPFIYSRTAQGLEPGVSRKSLCIMCQIGLGSASFPSHHRDLRVLASPMVSPGVPGLQGIFTSQSTMSCVTGLFTTLSLHMLLPLVLRDPSET